MLKSNFSPSNIATVEQKTYSRSLVIIDSAIDDIELLTAEIKLGTEIVVLHPYLDGVKQISAVLSQPGKKFGSVNIVAHGSSGSLQLGSSQLNLDNIESYSTELQTWSQFLAGTSLLIYGCEVAKGVEGEKFIRRLQQLTKTNIAASSTKIGNAEKGGNWQLDYQLGQVESELVFTSKLQASYPHLFIQVGLTTSTNNESNPDAAIEDEGTEVTFRFDLDEPAPNGGLKVYAVGDVEQIVNRLDVPGFSFNPTVENIDPTSLVFDFNNNGFAIVIDEGAEFGSLTIPIFDNSEPDTFLPETFDGLVNATFTLETREEISTEDRDPNTEGVQSDLSLLEFESLPVSDYTVDPDAASSTVIFADTASQLPSLNTPPETTDDTGNTIEDAILTIAAPGILENDIDGDGDTLTITAVNGESANVGTQITLESGALLTVRRRGRYRYNPNGQFNDLDDGETTTDSFEYTVTDGETETTATVNITINGITDIIPNPPPEATDDTGNTLEDAVLTIAAPGILENDLDGDNDTLTITAVNGESANVGNQIILESGALLTVTRRGRYIYDPNEQFNSLENGETATDSFEYTVTDGEDETTATVNITIDGITPQDNNLPEVINDLGNTTEDEVLNVATPGLLANDTVVDEGDTLVINAVNGSAENVDTQITLESGALLTVNADGSYSYDPNGQFNDLEDGETAIERFEYTATDGEAETDATVNITINGVTSLNNIPEVINDLGNTTEDEVLNVATPGLLANDTDADEGDTLTINAINGSTENLNTQIALASGALLTVNADGSYSYDPNGRFAALGEGETATDSFEYTVTDGRDETTGMVEISIDGVINSELPVVSVEATPNTLIEDEGTATTITFSLDQPAPEGGLIVSFSNTASERPLGDFESFQAEFTNIGSFQGFTDNDGATVLINEGESTASILLPIFDDEDRPDTDPNTTVNDDIGVEEQVWSIDPQVATDLGFAVGEYAVDPTASTFSLTLADTRDQLPDTPPEPEPEPEPTPEIPVEAISIENAEGLVEGVFYDTNLTDNSDITTQLTDDVLDLGTDADFDNLVGFYEIADVNGGIDTDGDGTIDLLPTDTGYAANAIDNRIEDWSLRAGSSGDASRNTTTEEFGEVIIVGDKLYAPFVIANGGEIGFEGFITTEEEENDAEFNDAAQSIDDLVAYFAFIGANPDGARHIEARGNNVFGFEDLPANLGVSDNDFNDAVFSFDFSV